MAARKNYSFEKNQRARAKAAKREAKREQKLAKKNELDGVESADAGDAAPEATGESAQGGAPSAGDDPT